MPVNYSLDACDSGCFWAENTTKTLLDGVLKFADLKRSIRGVQYISIVESDAFIAVHVADAVTSTMMMAMVIVLGYRDKDALSKHPVSLQQKLSPSPPTPTPFPLSVPGRLTQDIFLSCSA